MTLGPAELLPAAETAGATTRAGQEACPREQFLGGWCQW